MTIENKNSYIYRDGNGLATEFPFAFHALEAEHVKVSRIYPDGLVEPLTSGDYTVQLFGVGGAVMTTLGEGPLPTGHRLYIYRDTPINQEVNVSNQTSYNPTIVSGVWDKLTAIAQELRAITDRALLSNPGQDPTTALNVIYQARVDAQSAAGTATSAASTAVAAEANAATSAGNASQALAGTEQIRDTLLTDMHISVTPLNVGEPPTGVWVPGTLTIALGLPTTTDDWADLANKPAVIAAGTTQAAARTAIGLGALATKDKASVADIALLLRQIYYPSINKLTHPLFTHVSYGLSHLYHNLS